MGSTKRIRPLILISSELARPVPRSGRASLRLADGYPNAIMAGGGIPWVLPRAADGDVIAECVRRCDGILMSGGDDVQPDLYTSELPRNLRDRLGRVDAERDSLEQVLVREVLRRRKPLLAICRGQQMLNVALGGTLVVDIAAEIRGAINHNPKGRGYEITHSVDLTDGSLLCRITGAKALRVNSSHHQAVRRAAGPLRVTGASSDGIIESLELKEPGAKPFLLSVQYHPERLIDRFPEHVQLFRFFVRECAQARQSFV